MATNGCAISVCIVTAGRPDALRACLESLRRQELAPPWELLVCANGDPTVADTVLPVFPEATILGVPRKNPGAARNTMVRYARGEWLLFLDDDVTARADLLAHLERLATAHPDAAVFGGPNETPKGSTRFQVVQGAVLASVVGTGPVRRRYGRHAEGAADERFFTLCNLAVRRVDMLEFPPDLVCAEENAVLGAMHDRGLAMIYDPALVVFHDRRPDRDSFARQMRKYGFGRGQLMVRRPRAIRPAFLVPSVLLVYLVVSVPCLVVLASRHDVGLMVAVAAPLGAYAAAVTLQAAAVAATLRRSSALVAAAVLIAVVHANYGWGVLRGLVAKPRPVRQDRVEPPMESTRSV